MYEANKGVVVVVAMYFRLPAVGRLFPPTPLMKIITYLPWTLLTINFYLSFY